MQIFKVSIRPEARNDIQTAADWYETKEIGLGQLFIDATKRSIEQIRKMPYFEVRYDDIRFVKVAHFPFSIHFQVNEKQKRIEIVGVYHFRLDPEKWR